MKPSEILDALYNGEPVKIPKRANGLVVYYREYKRPVFVLRDDVDTLKGAKRPFKVEFVRFFTDRYNMPLWDSAEVVETIEDDYGCSGIQTP